MLPLWNAFEYRELLVNMRQKEHLDFALLMNRMRLQGLNNNDITYLKSRIIPKTSENLTMNNIAAYYVQIKNEDPETMALFPTNEEVNLFNELVVKQLAIETVIINADDSINHIKLAKTNYKRPCKFENL